MLFRNEKSSGLMLSNCVLLEVRQKNLYKLYSDLALKNYLKIVSWRFWKGTWYVAKKKIVWKKKYSFYESNSFVKMIQNKRIANKF